MRCEKVEMTDKLLEKMDEISFLRVGVSTAMSRRNRSEFSDKLSVRRLVA